MRGRIGVAIEPDFEICELNQPARTQLQARQLAVCDGLIEPRAADTGEPGGFSRRDCQRATVTSFAVHCSNPVGAGRAPADTASAGRVLNKTANKFMFD